MERTLEKGVVEYGRLHSAFHRENTHFQVCFLSVAIIQLWLQQLCPLLVIYLWPVIGIGVRKRVSLLCQNRPSLQTTDLYSSLKAFLKWPSYWILTSRVPTEEQLTGSEWDRSCHGVTLLLEWHPKFSEPSVSRTCCWHSCSDGPGQIRATKSFSPSQLHQNMPRPELGRNSRSKITKHICTALFLWFQNLQGWTNT